MCEEGGECSSWIAQKSNYVVNGHGAQSIKHRITNNASDVCRKAMRQTEQRNAIEQ
jgi:hypothetical protein